MIHSKNQIDDYSGSIVDYTKAIELNPNSPDAYYNRGYSKGENGDMEGACSDWRKASSLGDEDAAEFVKEDC